MPETASETDPQVLEDLRTVEQCCLLFGAAGTRAEFWEAFTLLKTGRDAVRAESERIGKLRTQGILAEVDSELADHLADIKLEFGPLARLLREFLAKVPGMPDGMRQDLALVFLMGSSRAREAVGRWVADPVATAGESTLRLKILARLVDAYRKALLDARRDAAVGTPPPARVHSHATTVRIKPDFVDDLRQVVRARAVLENVDGNPTWELVCLILQSRDEIRKLILDLEHLKANGKPGEFAGASYRMRQHVQAIRSLHGELAGSVRKYLERIYGGWGGEEDDLGFGFLLASQQGRHRAKQWLDDPELCRGEATATFNGLRSRARSYLDAMKHLPMPQPVP